MLRGLHARTRLPRLCLAGGCAMNSVANGKIREETPFRQVFVQPAAGDNGTALGAAFHVWSRLPGGLGASSWTTPTGGRRSVPRPCGGRSTSAARSWRGRACSVAELGDDEALCRFTAERLGEGQVVGWFQGRMEWGARALGNRSILADPRRADMREIINAKIKLRETFRPFAPSDPRGGARRLLRRSRAPTRS